MNARIKIIKLHFYIIALTISALLVSCSESSANAQSNNDLVDNELELTWIRVPGGTFMMGSPENEGEVDEHPQHEEQISTLDVLKTEVTVRQYKKCVAKGTCWFTLGVNPTYCNHPVKERINHPMNCINWFQSSTFCAWIDARLPSEAEWEYIASNRGQNIKYPWGNEPEISCDIAVIDDERGFGCGKNTTQPVCSHPDGNNALGFCDMAGNVFEWIYDWYYPKYDFDKTKNPVAMTNQLTNKTSANRIMRGGGIGSVENFRIRNRVFHDPHFDYGGLGVRCVRDVN